MRNFTDEEILEFLSDEGLKFRESGFDPEARRALMLFEIGSIVARMTRAEAVIDAAKAVAADGDSMDMQKLKEAVNAYVTSPNVSPWKKQIREKNG
jgi:tellurite resistance protein